jgi:hypothetical protein
VSLKHNVTSVRHWVCSETVWEGVGCGVRERPTNSARVAGSIKDIQFSYQADCPVSHCLTVTERTVAKEGVGDVGPRVKERGQKREPILDYSTEVVLARRIDPKRM